MPGFDPNDQQADGQIDDFCDLADLQEDYAAADDQVDDKFGLIPQGNYRSELKAGELKRTKTTGSPMVVFSGIIHGPKCDGRHWWKNNVLNRDDPNIAAKLEYMKKDFVRCGLRVNDLQKELVPALKRLDGIWIDMTVKHHTGDDGQTRERIYINRLVEQIDSVPPLGGARQEADAAFGGFQSPPPPNDDAFGGDDIPF